MVEARGRHSSSRNGPVTGAGPLGGGCRLFALHARRRDRRAAGRRRSRRAARRSRQQAAYLRETADIWNGQIERWTYATGTPLAKQLGVDGYYVRIAPPDTADAASPARRLRADQEPAARASATSRPR